MENWKGWVLKKKIHSLYSCHKGLNLHYRPKLFLVPGCTFISAVKLEILTWGWMETDSLLEPASSGHSTNCSFSYFLHFSESEVAAWYKFSQTLVTVCLSLWWGRRGLPLSSESLVVSLLCYSSLHVTSRCLFDVKHAQFTCNEMCSIGAIAIPANTITSCREQSHLCIL